MDQYNLHLITIGVLTLCPLFIISIILYSPAIDFKHFASIIYYHVSTLPLDSKQHGGPADIMKYNTLTLFSLAFVYPLISFIAFTGDGR